MTNMVPHLIMSVCLSDGRSMSEIWLRTNEDGVFHYRLPVRVRPNRNLCKASTDLNWDFPLNQAQSLCVVHWQHNSLILYFTTSTALFWWKLKIFSQQMVQSRVFYGLHMPTTFLFIHIILHCRPLNVAIGVGFFLNSFSCKNLHCPFTDRNSLGNICKHFLFGSNQV